MDLSIFSLEGKTAIVTGASRGIGKACALGLAGAGADVVLASRSLEDLKNTAKEIEGKGRRALPVIVDVLKEDDIKKMAKQTIDHFGKVDILVNNAGATRRSLVEHMDPDDWDWVMNTNLKSTFLCCKAVIPEMKKRGYGKIINMASLSGFRGSVDESPYGASKAGMMRFSESLALEVISYNITVNCICPGYVLTNMNEAFFQTEKGEKERERFPMKRPGKPEEIAGAVIYLASDASSYVTASSIIIDGAQRWKGHF